MLSALIGILIIVVIGAICFWAIEKFVRDGRLANLLKLLVVLICLAAICSPLLSRPPLPPGEVGCCWRWPGATEPRSGGGVPPATTSSALQLPGTAGPPTLPVRADMRGFWHL